ncbi:histidine phosphatase family protein [Paenibacillus kobensis]|uniref:histidine phosphatase family protein n=1 Tax=Paenibacillus kobensis TaxID=59841 RepID=UPI000FDBBFB5|nr:histidine phosphatase family protein [Paenibacillus kobensis]
MEFLFIRHGHGEHLLNYPSQLNTVHPSLTEYGKHQVTLLRRTIHIQADDLVLVSPTRRTIETAAMLTEGMKFIITPFVGPRMFPQSPELPTLTCDHILTKKEITNQYEDVSIIDFDIDCWTEGINRIEQDIFEQYANQLLDWIGDRYKRIVVISHDGTITNYRILLGEEGLTREDFLGEAGVYRMIV